MLILEVFRELYMCNDYLALCERDLMPIRLDSEVDIKVLKSVSINFYHF